MIFGFNAPVTAVLKLARVLVALAVAGASPAQQVPKPFSRTEAATRIAEARKIVNPGGVERLEKVKIGGIDQWVSIRGTDKRNPVLLLIHGGPGYISMPMSWWFTRGWEEYFTVVQWDQRAAGKTHLLNDPKAVGPTLNLERMVADAEEMTSWVRRELGKQQIFVVGHSWGSYLGLEVARRHPDWLHAYIGVGQLTDGPESERRGWAFALDAARRAGNSEAVRELEAIAPYSPPGRRVPLTDIYTQRKWLGFYGGAMAHRRGNSAESALADLSPDYTDEEISRIWQGNEFAEPYLLPEVLSLDLTGIRKLDCPLILFAGRHDFNVNSQVAAEWFANVKAPSKRFVWFENSAHLPMTEEPGKFLISLVRYARPIAERAGDTAPAAP
ncbi:MAG: alpha/beta fold family hydrolase [Bryobacterales bacterium]|nr:alpha/beta fold family hydrolase [Bryobacterales bacterium]